jgi:hypothetical protein
MKSNSLMKGQKRNPKENRGRINPIGQAGT